MLAYFATLQETATSLISSDETDGEKDGHHEAKLMEVYKSTSGGCQLAAQKVPYSKSTVIMWMI